MADSGVNSPYFFLHRAIAECYVLVEKAGVKSQPLLKSQFSRSFDWVKGAGPAITVAFYRGRLKQWEKERER